MTRGDDGYFGYRKPINPVYKFLKLEEIDLTDFVTPEVDEKGQDNVDDGRSMMSFESGVSYLTGVTGRTGASRVSRASKMTKANKQGYGI